MRTKLRWVNPSSFEHRLYPTANSTGTYSMMRFLISQKQLGFLFSKWLCSFKPMNRSRQRPSFNFSCLHGFQTYSNTERRFPDRSTSSIQTGILVWHMTIIFTFYLVPTLAGYVAKNYGKTVRVIAQLTKRKVRDFTLKRCICLKRPNLTLLMWLSFLCFEGKGIKPKIWVLH